MLKISTMTTFVLTCGILKRPLPEGDDCCGKRERDSGGKEIYNSNGRGSWQGGIHKRERKTGEGRIILSSLGTRLGVL